MTRVDTPAPVPSSASTEIPVTDNDPVGAGVPPPDTGCIDDLSTFGPQATKTQIESAASRAMQMRMAEHHRTVTAHADSNDEDIREIIIPDDASHPRPH